MARNQNITYPPDYSIDGTKEGRVVNMFNHANPVTGHMTIREYHDIRAKFEVLRTRTSGDVFMRILDHMASDGKNDYPQLSEDKKLAEKSGVTIGSAAQRSVAFEWKQSRFDRTHQPDFKVQIGEARQKSAVAPEFYETMGAKVAAFRASPAGTTLTGHFENMVKSGSANDMIWPEHWAKEHGLGSAASAFAGAVKNAGITNAPGLSLDTMRAFIRLNPASAPGATPALNSSRPDVLAHS